MRHRGAEGSWPRSQRATCHRTRAVQAQPWLHALAAAKHGKHTPRVFSPGAEQRQAQLTVRMCECDPKVGASVTVDVTVTTWPAFSAASCAAVSVTMWSCVAAPMML